MFRICLAFQDILHDLGCGDAVMGRPGDNPLWCTGGELPVGFRHIFRRGGMSSFDPLVGVGGDPVSLQKTLDGRLGVADIHLLFHRTMRNAVEMTFQFDVVIDVHPGLH